MSSWTVREMSEYVLKLCSEFSGQQFADEKLVRSLVAYKVLQFFCRKGFDPGPIAPRTIQTVASDMYMALKTSEYIVYTRTLLSAQDVITFRNARGVDPSYLEECYRGIRRKSKDTRNDQ